MKNYKSILQSATYEVSSTKGNYSLKGVYTINTSRNLISAQIGIYKTENNQLIPCGQLNADQASLNPRIPSTENAAAVWEALIETYNDINLEIEMMKTGE